MFGIFTHQNTKVSRKEIPTSDAPTTTMRALMVTCKIKKKTKHSRLQGSLIFLWLDQRHCVLQGEPVKFVTALTH